MQKIATSLYAGLLTVVATIVVAIAVSVSNAAAAGAANQGITLSPASTAPSAKPGGTFKGFINVLNDGSSNYTVKLYAEPYHVQGVNYDPSFTQLPGTTDASQWVNLSKSSVLVPAHKLVNTAYTLTIPAGTSPGGYYAVIFAETQPTTGTGVQSRDRVGDILYITAEGNIHTGGSIVNTSTPHFSTAGSLPLSLEVSNTGGVHFLTTANISITNALGKSVFSGNFQRYILPQTIRKISTSWKAPPVGFYHVARSATIAGRSESLPMTWIVIIQPWVIVVAVAIVALIVISLWLTKRRGRHSRKKKVTE